MRQILLAILAVLLGSVIIKVGNALLSLTIVLNLDAAGTSKQQIGFVAASFMVGFLAGGLCARRVIGQLGHVRAFAGVTSLSAIITLLFPLIESPFAWVLLRALYGFTGAISYVVFESWLNERATVATRGRVMSVYASSNYLALTVGQLLVNVTGPGPLAFQLCAMLVMAGLIPMVSTSLPQPELKQVQHLSIGALYRHSPLAVVAVTAGGLMNGGVFGLNALFAEDIGLSLLQISLFTGAGVFGAFLFLWVVGRVSDRYGRRAALAGALAIVVVTSTLLAASGWLGFGFPVLLAIALIQGAPLLSVYHSAVAHAYDRLPREHYVAASASFQIFFSVGSIVGPIICGSLMDIDVHALWIYVGSIAGLLLLFLAYRWMVRPQVVPDPSAPAAPSPPREGVTA
ncbi:MAG TPA: MFS transporter [Kiloniellales bacterium]|nr:MFS transporter [Kiloniellales bacterium]